MQEKCTLKQLRWQCGGINVLILAVAYVVHFIVISLGSFRDDIIYKSIGVSIGGCFLIGATLVIQSLVYGFLKKRLTNRTILAVLLLLPGVLLCGYILRSSLPTVRANGILLWAKLAPLPKTSHSIKVYTWSSPFSGENYLMFRASPQVLDDYITDSSPVLAPISYKIYTNESMRLHYPDDYSENLFKNFEEMHESPREYIYRGGGGRPTWFNEEIKNGRRYEFDVEGHYLPGELIINTDENTIYVRLVFS